MSNGVDPIRDAIEKEFGFSKDPIGEAIAAQYGRAAPRDDRSFLEKFMEGLKSAADPGQIRPTPDESREQSAQAAESLARAGSAVGGYGSDLASVLLSMGTGGLLGDFEAQQALGVGGLEGSIMKPARGVLGFPGAVLGREDLPTDKLADWIQRSSDGMRNHVEVQAIEAGVSEDTISSMYNTGNFIGMFAPIAASLKMASLLLRTGQTLGQVMATGAYTTDFVGGMIFGGLFFEGDAKRRLGEAAWESAAFGVMRTAVLGIGAPMRTMRHQYARRKDVTGMIEQAISDLQSGKKVDYLSPEQLRSLTEIIQGENFIVHSAAAQDLMAKMEFDAALVQAIVDVQGASGSAGMIRSIGISAQDMTERVAKMREQFPGLKFETVTRKDEFGSKTWDLFFGTKGLNNKQRASWKRGETFDGQVLHYGDQEVVYRGAAKRDGWIRVEMPDGNVRQVKASNTSEMPFIKEGMEDTAERVTLFNVWEKWLNKNQAKRIDSNGYLTEVDLVDGVRAGKLQLDPEHMRAFDSTALIYPQELGLVGDDLIHAISLVGEGPGGQQVGATIMRNARRGTPSEFAAGKQVEGPWRLDPIDPSTGAPIPGRHQAFNTLEEATQFAEAQGLQVSGVARKYPSAEDLARIVNESGTEYARLLDPPPALSFESMFDMFAKEVGIPKSSVDYLSTRAYFAHRTRRKVWSEMPDRDKKIFDAIVREHDELLEVMGDATVKQLAALKGFHAETFPDGHVLMRHIDTGLNMRFGSERATRDALGKLGDVSRDFDPLLRTGGSGMADWSRGMPKAHSISFDEMVASPEALANVHRQWYRNNRDWLISVEQQTGIPVWSKGFDPIQRGYTQMMSDLDPFARNIQKAWKGIPILRKHEVAKFWVKAEETGMTLNQAAKAMQKEGFSPREINALSRSRGIFDTLFQHTDIDRARYIPMYYTRVRPWMEKHGHADINKMFKDADLRPSEKKFWYEYTRTGDLSMMEMDPEIVMHKYARTVFFSKYVKEPWDDLARLTGTDTSPPIRFKDLPAGLREEKFAQAAPGASLDDPVVPKLIRDALSEYLLIIRGNTPEATKMSREFASRMFKKLGIEADDRVVEEMVNSWISMQYGAAMGLRPMAMARNMTQTMFLLYPRLGSKHGGRGLEISQTRAGYDEAVRVGAIPVKEATLPMGDVTGQHILEMSPRALESGNMFSGGFAGAINAGVRTLNVGRDFSQKSLLGYSSTDQASRAWSYHWQKLHTDEWLRKYETGKISWAKFQDEGLGFFPAPVKKKFDEIYNRLGREEALQHAGRWASDETNFIYGMGAQPAWMQSLTGRLGGMFGTWPLWAIEGYTRAIRHATPAQNLKYYGRLTAFTGAFANMGIQMGIDLWSWLAPISAGGWAGGPSVEHVINAKKFWDAPIDQKRQAFKRFSWGVSSLSVPGQIAFNDAMRSVDLAARAEPELAVLSMLMGRPYDGYNTAIEQLYNPDKALAEPIMSPETYQAREEGDIPSWINTLDFTEAPARPGPREAPALDSGSVMDDVARILGGF